MTGLKNTEMSLNRLIIQRVLAYIRTQKDTAIAVQDQAERMRMLGSLHFQGDLLFGGNYNVATG